MSLGFLLGLTPCDSGIPHNMHEKFGFITSYRSINSFLVCKSCPAWCCRIDLLSLWNLWHTSHEYEFATELWPLDETTLSKGSVPSTTSNNLLSVFILESWIPDLYQKLDYRLTPVSLGTKGVHRCRFRCLQMSMSNVDRVPCKCRWKCRKYINLSRKKSPKNHMLKKCRIICWYYIYTYIHTQTHTHKKAYFLSIFTRKNAKN